MQIQSWAEQNRNHVRRPDNIRPIARDEELRLIGEYVRSGRVKVLPPVYIGECLQPDNTPARQALQDVCRVFSLNPTALLMRSSAGYRRAALGKYALHWIMHKRGMPVNVIARSLYCSRSSITNSLSRVGPERRKDSYFAERLAELAK